QGVTVNVKGSNISVTTNAQGVFSIPVSSNDAVLTFSYVNYAGHNVKVGNQNNLTINLSQLEKKMDEVVVVGYGTQRKSDLTGSITQLKSKDISAVATSNVADA